MQSHKTNLKLTASESRLDLTSRSKKGRSIIVSDHDPDLQAELVHRVSESEKREIMKACPGFSEKNFIRDDKVESAPFKVVLGEGTYAKVVLGRLLASEETPQLNNNKDYKRFIAVRKVKSSSALLETTEQDRKNVLEMAEKELELHEKLKSSKALAADLPIVLFASHKKNKREEDQIYQALPLADFGNGIKLIKSIRKSSLTNDEKNTLIGFYIKSLVREVCALHAISCFIVDLKPENLLLKSSGELQLTDLGAATYYHNGPEQAPLSPSNFSDKGYLHPVSLYEIAKQKRVPDLSRLVRDRLNDHFALALTILQLCHPDLQEFVVRRMIRNTRNFERRYEDADAHYQDVVSDYTNIIDELKKLDSFNKLHPDLAGFLLQLLNLDYHSIQPLNDMANGCQNYFAVGSEDEEEARQLFSRMLSSQANTKQPVQDKKLSLSSPVLLGGYVGTVAEETKVTSTALPIIQLGHKKEKLLQSEEDISEIKADPHSDLSQSRFTSTALIDKLSRIIHADNYWQAKSSASKNKKFMPALNEMKQILQALDDFQSENEILAALAKIVSTNKGHGVSAFNLFPSCAPLSPQKILFQAIKKLAADVHHQRSLIDLEMLHEVATGMEKNENLSGRPKVTNLQN